MAIKNIVPVEESVAWGENQITVRGLSLKTISVLVQSDYEKVSSLFDDGLDIDRLLFNAPELVAKIISTAMGEPDSYEDVLEFPLGAQALLLDKIWQLTAVDSETLVKLIAGMASGTQRLANMVAPE